MYIRSIIVIVLILVSSVLEAQPYFKKGQDPKPKEKAWISVEHLSDEFDDSQIDTIKWQINPVGNDWIWIGRPPGLFKASNITVGKGKLCVTVGKLDSTEVVDGKKFTHQGGLVRALHPGQVGWYFECKMKANKTVMSSTFWLMTKYDCNKKLELDIQECVGRTTPQTDESVKDWDRIFHSNAIHRPTDCVERSLVSDFIFPKKKNSEKYFVYGAWWKSPEEICFFLDGKYVYSLKPTVEWDMPAFLHMAIETYSWNPIPDDGGLVENGSWKERTTQYKWIRTWKLN